MLFYLDESIITRLDEEIVRNALDNLGHAIKHGLHILYCERYTLESLYKSELLGSESRKVFRRLFF